jgi:diguanylate cyclase (GGDEF)-like protein
MPQRRNGALQQAEASYLLLSAEGRVLSATGRFGNGLSLPEVGARLDDSFAFLEPYLSTDAPLYLPRLQLQHDYYYDVHLLPSTAGCWVTLLDVTSEVRLRIKALGLPFHLQSDDSLLSLLEIVVFVYHEGLTLLTPCPPWLVTLYPEVLAEVWLPHETSYLGAFLIEARSHWQTQNAGQLSSGSWLEKSRLKKELNLEATALYHQNKSLLVLRLLGSNFSQLSERLQQTQQEKLEQRRIEQALLKQLDTVVAEQENLEQLALIDELTGLYNRRGFFVLANSQLQIAQVTHVPYLILYIDMDNLKTINDTLGHALGDRAIMKMAESLRHVFRDADIVARLGGDEFVVMAVGATLETLQPMLERLNETLAQYHAQNEIPFPLSASVGVAGQDISKPLSLEALLAQADRKMYEEKMRRGKGRGVTENR